MPGRYKAFSTCVYDVGLASNHARAIASAMKADIIIQKDMSFDAKVAIFPFPHPRMKEDVEKIKKRGVFTVAYWLGSDVYRAISDYDYNKGLPAFDLHVTCHQRLSLELKEIDIYSEVVHLFSKDVVDTNEKMKNVIGVYVPHTGFNYFTQEIVKIIQECPEYGFLVYGGGDLTLPKNAENMGKLSQEEVRAIFTTTKGSLRMTRHDGFPISIIDTKKHRRHVIATYPYEGCHEVKTIKESVNLIKNGLFEKEDDSHWPNWYRTTCSEFNFKTKIGDLVSSYANLPR